MHAYSNHRPFVLFFLLITAGFLFSCSPKVAPFDNGAYTQDLALKSDILALVDASSDMYINHEKEVADVQAKIDKMIDYELHRSHNDASTELWARMKNPKYKMFGTFLERWKKEGALTPKVVANEKRAMGIYLDQIAMFENSKSKKVK
jgi:hypothetical protein